MATYDEDSRHLCPSCGGFVQPKRVQLGYRLCLECGEVAARKVKHTVVCMPKSNYILVTDPTLLVGLNSSHKGNR